MIKTLLFLACAGWFLPVLAQSQPSGKARTEILSAQNKARVAADHTARLQARVIAEAAARKAESVQAVRPSSQLSHVPLQQMPNRTEVPSLTPLASVKAPAASLVNSEPDSIAQDISIAQQIHQGVLPCELGASVRVEADANQPGYFNVRGKGFSYRMYPVHTSTGALRLEDKKAGAVWLQLANKSMLMDQKKGRRMADECAHPEQVAYVQAAKNNPPPSLFDATGMGRSPD